MPTIDVTDVLLDPEIAGESFTVIRRAEFVNNFGERSSGEERILAIGAVTPTGDNSLVREEGYQLQNNTIRVITATLLRGPSKYAGQKFDPDIILWKGTYFVVRSLNEYSQYGAGLVEAECAGTTYEDPPPMNPA